MRARRHRGPAAVAALFLLAAACGSHDGHQGRTVNIEMRDIAFAPDRLEVKAGEAIEFVFHNTGQAEHEAFIGDEMLQESQEGGTSSGHTSGHKGSEHVSRVVLSPGRTGKLSYTFDQPGPLLIGCHVPTHWDAGMKVAVTVT